MRLQAASSRPPPRTPRSGGAGRRPPRRRRSREYDDAPASGVAAEEALSGHAGDGSARVLHHLEQLDPVLPDRQPVHLGHLASRHGRDHARRARERIGAGGLRRLRVGQDSACVEGSPVGHATRRGDAVRFDEHVDPLAPREQAPQTVLHARLEEPRVPQRPVGVDALRVGMDLVVPIDGLSQEVGEGSIRERVGWRHGGGHKMTSGPAVTPMAPTTAAAVVAHPVSRERIQPHDAMLNRSA